MAKTKASYIEEMPGGCVRIRLRIQPRSSKNAVEGAYGDALKVRLTAPPVEGEANKSLVKFLSKILGVKKGDITLESGEKSRDKMVLVSGLDEAEALRRIIEAS